MGQLRLKEQIRFYLDYLDLKAAQLSRKSKVPNATIADWLSGTKPRNVDQLKAVANLFECTIDHLLYGNGLPDENRKIDNRALDALIGDEWIGGRFEVRIRRLKGGI